MIPCVHFSKLYPAAISRCSAVRFSTFAKQVRPVTKRTYKPTAACIPSMMFSIVSKRPAKIIDNVVHGAPFKSKKFMQDLKNQTIDEYVTRTASATNRSKICTIDATTNEKLTMAEIMDQTVNLAASLQELGCRANTVVGIASENRLQYLPAGLASMFSGAILTCFNPLYTRVELDHTFDISRPEIIFCSSLTFEKICQMKERKPYIRHIIQFDDDNGRPTTRNDRLLFSDLIKKKVGRIWHKPVNSPNDTVLILYSSGTTGYPKGVAITHRNLVFMLKSIKDENIFDYHGRYTVATVPFFHAYGLFVNIQTLVLDETLVFLRKFDEQLFLKIIQDYKVQFLFLVPPLVTFFLKDPRVSQYDLSSFNQSVCGAAPLKEDVQTEFKNKMNLKYLYQAYGMTEATFVTCIQNKTDQKVGCVGPPISGVRVKIVDPETGDTLGVRSRGELLIQGPHVMKEYHGNDEATRTTIDADGWLHSGDIAYYDDQGHIFIVDRLKELIKYKGYQVAPAELEALLQRHKAVYEAAVIGIPDDVAGELPKAFVVTKPGHKVTEKDLVDYVSNLVSPQKKLRGGVQFIDQIPKTASGKMRRKELKEKYHPATIRSKY